MFRLATVFLLVAVLASASYTTLEVWQSDFDNGSLNIAQEKTKVVLKEDIQFGAWPAGAGEPDSSLISPLGFFAAIVIAADDVEIDLNGHELSMDPDYYLKQRFFALIEVGSKPFIQGQGPANFGVFTNVSKVEIHNGVLGLSSHHSIHGSEVSGVYIHDLVMKDFEVAGVQLNGAVKTTIEDCEIGPNAFVTVNAALSNAIFLLPELEKASLAEPGFTIDFGDGAQSLDALKTALEVEVALGENSNLFVNPSGVPDGSAIYGILIHRVGVAIGPVGDGEDSATSSIIIRNVYIHDLAVNITEWGSMEAGVGPFGDKFNFGLVTDASGAFNGGNALFNAQLALAQVTATTTDDSFSGAFSLDKANAAAILQWAQDGVDIEQASFYQPVCGTDVMRHTNKGAFGMRLEFTDTVTVRDVLIENVQASIVPSKFCDFTLAESFGISSGLHDKLKLKDVAMKNTGTYNLKAFNNSYCALKKVYACGSQADHDCSGDVQPKC